MLASDMLNDDALEISTVGSYTISRYTFKEYQ